MAHYTTEIRTVAAQLFNTTADDRDLLESNEQDWQVEFWLRGNESEAVVFERDKRSGLWDRAERSNLRGRLCDYATNEEIRDATDIERRRSAGQSERDGGREVIEVDGAKVYVQDC